MTRYNKEKALQNENVTLQQKILLLEQEVKDNKEKPKPNSAKATNTDSLTMEDTGTISNLQAKITEIENQNAKVKKIQSSLIDQLKAQLKETEKKLQSCQATSRDQKARLQSMLQDIDALSMKTKSQEQQVKTLRQQHSDKDLEIRKKTGQVEDLQKKINFLEARENCCRLTYITPEGSRTPCQHTTIIPCCLEEVVTEDVTCFHGHSWSNQEERRMRGMELVKAIAREDHRRRRYRSRNHPRTY